MSGSDYLDDYLRRWFETVDLGRRLSRARTGLLELQRDARRLAGPDGLRTLALLLLWWGTNVRVRELCALRVEDLDLGEGGPGALRIRGPDGERGPLPLDEELAALLRRYLQSQGDRERGPLFLDGRGRSFHEKDLWRLLAQFPRQAMLDDVGQHFSLTSRSECAVLPTPLRLNTNPRYTGRGVTMAFLDSGFYPHPDLMQPRRRVLAYKNVAGGARGDFEKSDDSSWHGMQTSVSAAGNGFLSGGLFRGVACDAELVLVQVRGPQGIRYDTIVAGFEWVIKKKDRYGIRILNVSLGTSREQSYRLSPLDGVAEDAVQAGIVVLVAAGNEGDDPGRNKITPPASAPSVITVGGLNDQNSLNLDDVVPYHSNFGETVDGVVKPELVAPGIWVAAPILPGSPLYQKAQLLWELKDRDGAGLREAVAANLERLGLPRRVLDLSADALASRIREEVAQEKLIHPHYQHVDGTSFSSPIVGSVIAQMLEANPALTPDRVKELLIQTAVTIPGIPRVRQGYGMVNPRAAVEAALRSSGPRGRPRLQSPEVVGNTVRFRFRHDTARRVAVACSARGWDPEALPMERRGREGWEAELEVPRPGTFHYKFVVDGERWLPDPECLRNENDGYGGTNSVFEVHTFPDTDKTLDEIDRELRSAPADAGSRSRRRDALIRLDDFLLLSTVAKSDAARQYFVRQWERLLDDLASPAAPGTSRVHLLYNMGVVVRTGSITMGFDLVSTRHVLGVYWDVDDSLIERTLSALDVLFVTHRHADHLDIELAERMIRAGKPVVGPSEASDVLPRGVLAFEPGERRELHGVGARNATLAISAHPGRHVRGRTTAMRVYEVGVDSQFAFVHAGDHDFAEGPLPWAGPPDLLVAHVDGVGGAGLGRLAAGGGVGAVVLAHLAELGHTLELGRPGYGRAYRVADGGGAPCVVLGWGESYGLLG